MWIVIIMYLLLIPNVALFIHARHKNMRRLSVALKSICTGIILLTGLAGTLGSSGETFVYAALITAGLAMGLAGDVAICFRLTMGALFFGLGHCCYIAAMLRVSAHALWGIPVFIALYLLVLIVYKKINLSLGALLIPGIPYSIIITGMLSLAATMPFSVFPGGFVLFLGAALFTASDIMLAFNTLGRLNQCRNTAGRCYQRRDTVYLSCYYLGQSLFAASIFCMTVI